MTTNQIAFLALCNEYCAAAETPAFDDARDLAWRMLRLLPRIYICASDIRADADAIPDTFIAPALDERHYDEVRHRLEAVLGEDDTYLEVFEQDMKYSDTPIGASIAEGLADLFQVFYNAVEALRDAPDELADDIFASISDDFASHWSQTLCNVMRPLNHILNN